jgi:6-aminohexanoate-oligomer endohydrolase
VPSSSSLYIPEGAATAIDVRGGNVGKVGDYEFNHAICLAGGSLPGLEATAGIAAELWDRGGRSLEDMPLVSGAIVFDYDVRTNRVHPDMALGRAALSTAREGVFPLGAHGAGRSASCGGVLSPGRGEPSGQGGAFRQEDSTKVAVFSVVNSAGVVVDRRGGVVRGNRDPETREREHPLEGLRRLLGSGEPAEPSLGNTTLTVVVTNRRLEGAALTQLARQVHSSMARAIQPFHTPYDGDVLYAVSTGEPSSAP